MKVFHLSRHKKIHGPAIQKSARGLRYTHFVQIVDQDQPQDGSTSSPLLSRAGIVGELLKDWLAQTVDAIPYAARETQFTFEPYVLNSLVRVFPRCYDKDRPFVLTERENAGFRV